jgi:hypothetical protein
VLCLVMKGAGTLIGWVLSVVPCDEGAGPEVRAGTLIDWALCLMPCDSSRPLKATTSSHAWPYWPSMNRRSKRKRERGLRKGYCYETKIGPVYRKYISEAKMHVRVHSFVRRI